MRVIAVVRSCLKRHAVPHHAGRVPAIYLQISIHSQVGKTDFYSFSFRRDGDGLRRISGEIIKLTGALA